MSVGTMGDGDRRRVALIKSLRTKNRFYTLVLPERGLKNADTIDDIPEDLLLGIAYPCLEDGLNDFAVIRTTYETLDLFPEDDPIRTEMMEIVNDARDNLVRRLEELRYKVFSHKASFLGTDYDDFKTHGLSVIRRGYQRRTLDSMMKLNVFCSVAEAEGHSDPNDLPFRYELNSGNTLETMNEMQPNEFIVALFDDVLASVLDDANYRAKYLFDRNVFQKFIALMFINYATTDPMFYGINKKDYGVSGEKEMDDTPLYLAIRKELLEIERRLMGAPRIPSIPAVLQAGAEIQPPLTSEEMGINLPHELVNEEILLGPITSVCMTAHLLIRKNDSETERYARAILADAEKLVDELKRIGIISPLTNNPGKLN